MEFGIGIPTSGDSWKVAQRAEELGFTRFWVAEHHGMAGVASSSPPVLIGHIASATKTIRVGSGGVMLPHYSPMKVAETFRVLHALYPGRVDLGIGRAPGGSPLDTFALRRDRSAQPLEDDFPKQLLELIAFLHGGFRPDHAFSRIELSPAMPGAPEVWLLGSSMWSAAAAVEFGLPYSFAHFFSPVHTRAAIETYRRGFTASQYRSEAEATVAVGVICAATQEEAEFLASSVRLLQRRIRQGDRRPVASPEDAVRELRLLGDMPMEEGEWPRYFVGTPARVKEQLEEMASELGIGELIVNTIVWEQAKRLRSYELLAGEFAKENT